MNVDDTLSRKLAADEQLAANEFEVYEDLMRDACEAKIEDDEIAERDEHVRSATDRLTTAEQRRLKGAIPTTEAQAEKAVVELFQLYGWEVRRIREDIHNRDGKGLPDLLCTSKFGEQVWVEMKRPPSARNPKGHVRKAQKELLAAWRERGVPCLVADGVDDVRAIAMNHANTLGIGRDLESLYHACDRVMAPRYDWWPL